MLGLLLKDSDVDWELTYEDKFLKKVDWMEKMIKSIDKMKERYYDEYL